LEDKSTQLIDIFMICVMFLLMNRSFFAIVITMYLLTSLIY